MSRVHHQRAVAVLAGIAVVLLTFVGQPAAPAATVDVVVDGGQKFQTIAADQSASGLRICKDFAPDLSGCGTISTPLVPKLLTPSLPVEKSVLRLVS